MIEKENLIILVKRIFEQNKNITSELKKLLKLNKNTPEIIELAYDMQAGDHIKLANGKNKYLYENRVSEMKEIFSPYLHECKTLLDIGIGESATFSRFLKKIENYNISTYGCDISWSRLFAGLKEMKKNKQLKRLPKLFVSDFSKIPFADNSIDITTSFQALEPNGKNLNNIIPEIFRCTNKYCIFIEPDNSLADNRSKKRMKTMGYIHNLDKYILRWGGGNN